METRNAGRQGGGGRGGGGRGDGGRGGKRDESRNLPGVPKPPVAPDKLSYQNKINKKQEEINKYRSRMNEIREKLSTREVDPAREAFYVRQKELTAKIRQVQGVISQERGARVSVNKNMREARQMREELESKLQILTGKLVSFKDVNEIEAALNHLEYKLETEGSGSLKQEKGFLQRRKLLENAKEQVEKLKPLREHIDAISDKELECLDEAKTLQKRLDDLNKELQELAVQKNSETAPSGNRDALNALKTERNELYSKMTKCYEEIDEIRETQNKEYKEWKKKMDAWRVILAEAIKERDEQRKKRDEERLIKQKAMDEIRKLNPHEDKIDTCSTLIRYLEDKISAKAPKREVRKVIDPADRFKTGDEDDVDWLYQDRRKVMGMGKNKSKPGEKKRSGSPASANKKHIPKDAPITFDIHRLLSFEQLSIDPPRMTSQIANTIDLLKKKKEYYKGFIVTEETETKESNSTKNESEEKKIEKEAREVTDESTEKKIADE